MASTKKNNQVNSNIGVEEDPACICLRPTNYVFCQSCGAVYKGRCRKECSKHPRTIYLMDNEECAFCKKRDVLMEIS